MSPPSPAPLPDRSFPGTVGGRQLSPVLPLVPYTRSGTASLSSRQIWASEIYVNVAKSCVRSTDLHTRNLHGNTSGSSGLWLVYINFNYLTRRGNFKFSLLKCSCRGAEKLLNKYIFIRQSFLKQVYRKTNFKKGP